MTKEVEADVVTEEGGEEMEVGEQGVASRVGTWSQLDLPFIRFFLLVCTPTRALFYLFVHQRIGPLRLPAHARDYTEKKTGVGAPASIVLLNHCISSLLVFGDSDVIIFSEKRRNRRRTCCMQQCNVDPPI